MNSPLQQNPKAFQEMGFDDEVDLGKLLGTLVDGRWIIIPITILFALMAITFVIFSTPIYKADALLQVEEKPSSLSGLGGMAEIFSQEASAITETEVIKSRMVIGKAVDELNLDVIAEPNYFPLIGRGLIRLFGESDSGLLVSLFSGYAWGGEIINVTRLLVPDYLLGNKLTLVAGENHQYDIYGDGDLLLSGKIGVLAEGSGIQILVTDLVSRPSVEFSIARKSRLDVIQLLQGDLNVTEKGRRSGVLLLSLEGENKSKTRNILNSISNHYLLQNVERLSAEAEKGLEFINAQLPDIKAKLDASEQLLSDYRLKNRSVDLSLETQKILEQVVNLDAQLNELSFKEAELRKNFTREHPSYIALMKNRETLLTKKQELEKQVELLPETQQEILRFTRDAEVNQGVYLQLLNKVNELSVVKAGTVGNVRILDIPEVLTKPIKPRKSLVMTIATVLGFVIGVVVVFVRAALHRGLRSTDEIEAIGLPVYATVPFSETQKKISRKLFDRKLRGASNELSLLAVSSNDDLSLEAIRSLRTSMHFGMLETDDKVLMITGPTQDIGKSFVSANLAAVYSQMGQKVLLIDADMRKGHIQSMFNLEQADGLSELLSGQIEKQDAIKKTEVENLHLITCGMVPPNPSELLMLPSFSELMEWSKVNYDLVIIDTPPALAVTDATVIGRFAGISMLVARFDVTPVKEIEATLRRCEQNGVKIKGCIINGVIKKAGYGNYGHYGYYSYSYKK